MPKRAAALGLLLCTAAAATGPIRSYDFFWHLATGRWIVEHRALPLYDPFALASAHIPWINGEWLWEIAAYAVQSVAGFGGVSILNAFFVAAIFTLAFWFAARESDTGVALLGSAIGFAGASDRLGIRPAEAAALLMVCAIALLASRLSIGRLTFAYALLTVIWINTHPSALLAPLLAAITVLIDGRRVIVAGAGALALLVNPFGWRAVASPIALTRTVTSGAFVNAEWLPSSPLLFPFLYLTILAFAVAFLTSVNRRGQAWKLVAFVLLAVLAIQHVRNQGLYFAAFPLLFPPVRRPSLKASLAVGLSAVVPIGWVFAGANHSPGVDPSYFPIAAVARLQNSGLRGNIYNADQFGGYLEWTFYPQRRVITDGRNELFASFIGEDARARSDSRAWNGILRRYAIDLAVDEIDRRRIEVIDAVTRQRRSLSFSQVRYPRREWALIAFDGVAMVFARRAAFPPDALARLEIRGRTPDE